MDRKGIQRAFHLCPSCHKPPATCLCACLSIVSLSKAIKSSPKPVTINHLPLRTPSDLVVLWENSLNRWDLLCKQWKNFTLTASVQVDTESRWMWVQDWLFCCGGKLSLGRGQDCSGIRSAYSVRTSGKVDILADMITSRGCHGLWWGHTSKIYVFGGNYPLRPQ